MDVFQGAWFGSLEVLGNEFQMAGDSFVLSVATRKLRQNFAMDPSISGLLLKMIRSEIELAQAFASISRSAYHRGDTGDGDVAREKAEAVYSRALLLVEDLPERDRESIRAELDRLWKNLRSSDASAAGG